MDRPERAQRFLAVLGLFLLVACGGPADEQSVSVLNRSAAHGLLSFLDGTNEVIPPCSFRVWRGSITTTWTFHHRGDVVTSGELPYRNERRAVAIEARAIGGLDVSVSDTGVAPDATDPHPCEADLLPSPSPPPS